MQNRGYASLVQENFTKNASLRPSSLTDGDPDVCNVRQGISPVILTGPHNGFHVPSFLADASGKPLGVESSWFDPNDPSHRHEACDWGTAQLFDLLQKRLPHAHTLTANYSRLVVDFNRTRDHIIMPHSSEYPEQTIPGNTDLTDAQLAQRHDIYDAYIHKLDALINDVKTQHGGGAIILDLHSFAPEWKGRHRGIPEMGVITLDQNNALGRYICDFLSDRLGDKFLPNFPYNLHDEGGAHLRETALIYDILKRHNLEIITVEFRNDILQSPERVIQMADLVLDLVTNIQKHPNLDQLMGIPPKDESDPETAVPEYA